MGFGLGSVALSLFGVIFLLAKNSHAGYQFQELLSYLALASFFLGLLIGVTGALIASEPKARRLFIVGAASNAIVVIIILVVGLMFFLPR